MEGNKSEFRHESLHDAAAVINYLKAITAGLESGALRLARADDTLTLSPQGLVRMKVRAEQGGRRSGLSLKLTWRTADVGELTAEAPLEIVAVPDQER